MFTSPSSGCSPAPQPPPAPSLGALFCCKLPSAACCSCQAAGLGLTAGCPAAAFCFPSVLPPLCPQDCARRPGNSANLQLLKSPLPSEQVPKAQASQPDPRRIKPQISLLPYPRSFPLRFLTKVHTKHAAYKEKRRKKGRERNSPASYSSSSCAFMVTNRPSKAARMKKVLVCTQIAIMPRY